MLGIVADNNNGIHVRELIFCPSPGKYSPNHENVLKIKQVLTANSDTEKNTPMRRAYPL